MTPLCLIPARRGSKRLRDKNLAPLGGRPLVAWTIAAARESGVFDHVYVSTEDAEIAAIAEREGAVVPGLRPADLAGDTVTNVAVALHLHDRLAAEGAAYDAVVCLQPSSPLRDGRHVAEAWQAFRGDDAADFLVSVSPIDPHDFHWALHEGDTGWVMFFGDRFLAPRQDLPPVFRPNGAIKIATVPALRKTGNFFGAGLAVYEMPPDRSVHVATAFDLSVCEACLAASPEPAAAHV